MTNSIICSKKSLLYPSNNSITISKISEDTITQETHSVKHTGANMQCAIHITRNTQKNPIPKDPHCIFR